MNGIKTLLMAGIVTLTGTSGLLAAAGPYLGFVDSVRDAADGDMTVPCYGEIKMQGWAANQGGSGVRTPGAATNCSPWATAACRVKAYQGSVSDVTWLGYPRSELFIFRPDVQSAFGRSDFLPSGFTTYANVGGCHDVGPGPRTYVGAAEWDAFGPYPLANSGTMTLVRNDKVDYPGIVSELNQAGIWKSTGTVTFSGNTSNYVNDYTKSSQWAWMLCTGATGKDAVWRFRLLSSAHVTIQTAWSSFDTVLYVIRSDNTSMGCNDDYAGTLQSRLDLALAPGDYYVFLDGYSASSQGAFRLDFSWTP